MLRRNWLSRVVWILCLSGLIAPLDAAHASGGGEITRVRGEVWLTPAKKDKRRARVGDAVAPGARLSSGPSGRAFVEFGDGSELRLRPDTSILLSGKAREERKKTSVLLFFGRVWSKVARAVGGDEPSYEVGTANAVCGVRGTEFETAVADDGAIRVTVTEGKVGVADAESQKLTTAGESVEGDEQGLDDPEPTPENQDYEAWRKQRRARLRQQGKQILARIKRKIMSRKDKLEALRQRQKKVETLRAEAEAKAREGDKAALDDLREYNRQLAELADAIADIGNQAEAQFGLVDHFADLAGDPRFKMVDRKTIAAEAENLRAVKKNLDAMVAAGTDISLAAMEKLIDEMRKGGETLRDDKGSAADELFGNDEPFDMP